MLQHKHFHSIQSSSKLIYSRKQSQYSYLIPKVPNFLSLCPYLHLILWTPSEKLLTRFNNELAINLALLTNCNMQGIFFVISSPFLSILASSFSFGTVKVMYFSGFSPKQLNCFFFLILLLIKSLSLKHVHYILNCICYVQHLYIPLYNNSDL